MSAYIQVKEAASIDILGKQALAMYQPYRPESLPANIYDVSYKSLGDGLADGEVPAGYVPEAGSTLYTASIGQPSGSANYYMDSDITVSFSSFVEDTAYSGIFDGCGHTLTINCYKDNYTANSAHSWGAFIGTLTGTLKNIKIVTRFTWRCTKSNGYHQYVGGVCGAINGGIIMNTLVDAGPYSGQTYNMIYTGRPTSRYHKLAGGIAGTSTGTSNIIKTTVIINDMGWQNTDGGSWTGRPDCRAGVVGFVGHNGSNGTLNMINVTSAGAGILTTNCASGGTNMYAYKAAFMGYIENGHVNILGSNNAWSGHTQDLGGTNTNCECSMVADARNSNNLTITNVFYTPTSYAKVNGYLEWQATKTALFGSEYTIPEANIGFCLSNNDKIWIGEYGNRNAVNGSYVKTITINNIDYTINQGLFRPIENNFIPVFNESDITGNITAYDIGYYGYVSNEAVSGGYKIYYKNGTKTYTDSLPATVPSYDAYETRTIDGEEFYLIKNTNIDYYS